MHKQSLSFKVVNYGFFLVLGILTIYPFWDVAAGSLMHFNEYAASPLKLFPKDATLHAYKVLFYENDILTPMKNSVFVTIAGTITSIAVTTMGAYALSRPYLIGRRSIMVAIIFTMIFSGGLIPLFMIVRNLHILDSLWALVLVPLINTFYLIIMRTFFGGISESLEESAKIEGAGDMRIFLQIMIPLSMPMIATMILYVAVDRWNDLFTGLIFVNSGSKEILQVFLYKLISNTDSSSANRTVMVASNLAPATLKMAAVMITTLPMLIIYPFLQKFFINGVMLGSVKG